MVVSEPSSPPKGRFAATMQHRVLIYTTCYNVLDGVTLTIRKLEQEILAAGHHVCILTTESGDPANTNLDGTHPNRQVLFLDNAFPIPFLTDPDHPEQSYSLGFSLSPAMKQKIEDFEPSLIHITVPDCTSLHVIQYARTKEIPIMGTYHSNIPEYMEHYPGLSWLKHILGAFFRHQYNFLQALYVPTPYIQRHLIDDYKMDRVTTLKVWGRGVDVEKFNPAFRSLQYRRSLGIDDNTPIVLWVGRLVPEKRPDIYASVIRRLHSKGLKFHGLVVGSGPCEAEMKKLPNTTFAGWMNAEQLSTAYASSDIFLFPSAVETFGNVTLEAAASGLPVIVESGCSGHLVHDGENGFACHSGDEEAFFESTAALVEDKQMREEYSMNSRDMAISLEKRAVVRQMLDHYSRVTDEFYTEYSGLHTNRDSVYTTPDSFRFGKFPRPLFLICVEYIFVILFLSLFQVSNILAFFQRFCCPIRQGTSRSSNHEVKVPSPPLPTEMQRQASQKLSSSRSNSIVELEDVEIGKSISEPLLSADDTTATTSNSSQHTNSSVQTFGDCRLSHTLAKTFVSSVQFTCRVESHIRMLCCSSAVNKFRGAAKRKNSSMAVSLSDLNTGRPELVVRSRTTEVCADIETAVPLIDESPSSTGLQESRVMRRAQSNAIEVF